MIVYFPLFLLFFLGKCNKMPSKRRFLSFFLKEEFVSCPHHDAMKNGSFFLDDLYNNNYEFKQFDGIPVRAGLLSDEKH